MAAGTDQRDAQQQPHRILVGICGFSRWTPNVPQGLFSL